MAEPPVTGAVIIGRNEGERLLQCLASVPGLVARVVYVDSGSTDNSVTAARAQGAEVVELDLATPFTAARARNAGFARLTELCPCDYVQFIDGDCALRDGWIETALEFLETTPEAAVACGRRRERFPEASVYNWLCDREWDTPVGRTRACGGDALMRRAAFDAVDGFNPGLIAGEEPDLCVRLRAAGWQIWRLDHEMTWHDAAILRFGQWWTRTRRAGFAYAQGAALHGAPPERHWVRETRSALLWGAVLPVLILAATLILGPWALLGVALYPVQIARIARRDGGTPEAWQLATSFVIAKFAQALGALEYWSGVVRKKRAELIEYK